MRRGGDQRPAVQVPRSRAPRRSAARMAVLAAILLSLAVLVTAPALAGQPGVGPGSEPAAAAGFTSAGSTPSASPTAPAGQTATAGQAAASNPISTSTSADDSASWTLAQAQAAVQANTIARLPGAPAVMDEATVRAAIGNAPIRIALVPFVPVDDNRTATEQQASQLQSWGQTRGWGLIVVQGLQVLVGVYDVQPGAVADLQPVLASNDVTHQVLRAITELHAEAVTGQTTGQTTTDDGQSVLPAERTADPAQVQLIGDALATDRVYSDPELGSPQTVTSDWANVGAGLTVRAAFLPAVARGEPLTDLITPLSKRFPGDVVVVMRGRWIEVAGPDQEILDSAVLWLYGNYMKPFLRWDVQPTALVGLLAGQIGLLRTGVVSDQTSPATPTDPVTSSRTWLPWLFVGTALVLAGIAGWWTGRSRRNRTMAAEARTRSDILVRRRFGARLAAVAGRIVDLDGLTSDAAGGAADATGATATARDDVDAAIERYRVARDVLTDDGDLEVAGEALDAAEDHLVSAGRALHAPLSGEAAGPSAGSGSGAHPGSGPGSGLGAGSGWGYGPGPGSGSETLPGQPHPPGRGPRPGTGASR